MGVRNDVNRYTRNGEETKDHIHSLISLVPPPKDGYRYQCVVCDARLKAKSGVMIDELKQRRSIAKTEKSSVALSAPTGTSNAD